MSPSIPQVDEDLFHPGFSNNRAHVVVNREYGLQEVIGEITTSFVDLNLAAQNLFAQAESFMEDLTVSQRRVLKACEQTMIEWKQHIEASIFT